MSIIQTVIFLKLRDEVKKKTCGFKDIVPIRGGEGSGETLIEIFFSIRT